MYQLFIIYKEVQVLKKKGLIIKIVAVVLVLSIGAGIGLYINDRNRDFNNAEKITIAMGTVMTQRIYGELHGKNIADIISLVSSLEDNISCKKEGAALSLLNKTGASENLIIYDALKICNEVSEKSGGVFDVSVGNAVSLWGIGTSDEGIPSQDEIAAVMEKCGYEKITLEDGKITLDGDFSIDLGAVGKGLACDYIMKYLRSSGVNGGVVSVGGSILAYGQQNKAGDKWRVAVRHPREENKFLGVITMGEGFVSTSGDYEKYFEEDGKRYHHILDGNTGYPSRSGLISVTVVCDSGILSDALSTACFILGREKGEALLKQYGASGIFVDEGMNVTLTGDIDFEYSE